MILQHKKNLVFVSALSAMIFNVSFAEELGRLFTTVEERQMLDGLRNAKPKEIEVVEVVEVIEIVPEEVVEEEPKPVIGGITVNGLVYRKGRKSTAWINNENTYEGHLSHQYIHIDPENINPDGIQVEIPENVTDISLKVGETYDPSDENVTDLTDNYNQ